jgi:hypothetical protein
MADDHPDETGRDSSDHPPDVAVTKPRKRRPGPMLLIAGVVALAVIALVLRGLVPGGHESRADKDEVGASEHHDRDAGEEGEDEDEEEDGGPTAPAEYLTQKFTSGHDVSRHRSDTPSRRPGR